MATIKIKELNRIDNIQALRFIAAALVLLTHTTFYIKERVNHEVDVWGAGTIGVPIFFVISGFVMQLTSKSFINIVGGATQFLVRRISRICPLYWMLTTFKVVLALAIPSVVLHNHANITHIIASYLFFPMYNMDGEIRPIHGVGWTLFHEMFFYGLFTFAIFFNVKPWKFCSAAIVVLVLIGHYFRMDFAIFFVITDNINLLFIAGIFIAIFYQAGHKIDFLCSSFLLFTGVALITISPLAKLKIFYIGAFPIESIVLVLSLVFFPVVGSAYIRNIFNRLGDASYSLYLCHPIIAPAVCVLAFRAGIENIFLIIVISILTTVIISTLVHYIFEIPANKIFRTKLDRIFRTKLG